MTNNKETQTECTDQNSEYADIPTPELEEENTDINYPRRTKRIMHHEGKNPNWTVCPFNLVGQCRHGYNCWYRHDFRNVGTDADWNLFSQSSYRCPRHQIKDEMEDTSACILQSTSPNSSSIIDDNAYSSQVGAENFKSVSHVESSSPIIQKHSYNSKNCRISSPSDGISTTTAISSDSLQTYSKLSRGTSSPDPIAFGRSTKESSMQTDPQSSSTINPSSYSSSQVNAARCESVLLNADESSSANASSSSPFDERIRAEAPEFVPQSWRDMASESELCPNFLFSGKCSFSSQACPYVHGERCDMCQLWCLGVGKQRRLHLEQCRIELEAEMEEAFVVQRSQSKKCGICHDVVWDKEPPSEQRFGILESCNHVFCLRCIRTWRRIRRNSDPLVHVPTMPTRQCPECRVHSDYFVPSSIWVEDGEEKLLLLQEYKISASMKPCRYFSVYGSCPLGDACFYLHATFDGAPQSSNEQQSGELDPRETMLLWNFLETKEE